MPKTSNNDTALSENVSYNQLSYFVELGPCQPNPLELEDKVFPKTFEKNGKFRSFHAVIITKQY